MKLGYSVSVAVAFLQWGACHTFGQEAAKTEGRLVDRLKSTNATVVAKAVDEARHGLAVVPARHLLYMEWIPALMSAHRYDEVIELASLGIVHHAWDSRCLKTLENAKITALLTIGKNEDALAEAKAYYNACSMGDLPLALKRVEECLAAAYPDKPEIVERFRQEQNEGAKAPVGDKPLRSSVMDSIRITRDPHAEMPATLAYKTMTEASLLLLADKPQDARQCFDKMLAASTRQEEQAAAREGLARCMKAEDGTTGRAEAWLAKQREAK